MVRRYRMTPFYPSGYPINLPDNQSSVPSQHSHVPPAFDPKRQPDMQPTPISSRPDVSIVRASFDSRPPYAYDWFFEDFFEQGTSTQDGYTIPVGYILILRKVVLSVYAFSSGDLGGEITMSPFGDLAADRTLEPPFLQITVDNLPATDWTVGAVQLFDLFNSDVEIETFIKILGGSNLNINLPGPLSVPPLFTPTRFNTYVHYYGNMLLSTGRNIINEVGNAAPLPVSNV